MLAKVLPPPKAPEEKITITIHISQNHLRMISAFAQQTKLRSIDQAFEYAIEDLCGVSDDAEG